MQELDDSRIRFDRPTTRPRSGWMTYCVGLAAAGTVLLQACRILPGYVPPVPDELFQRACWITFPLTICGCVMTARICIGLRHKRSPLYRRFALLGFFFVLAVSILVYHYVGRRWKSVDDPGLARLLYFWFVPFTYAIAVANTGVVFTWAAHFFTVPLDHRFKVQESREPWPDTALDESRDRKETRTEDSEPALSNPGSIITLELERVGLKWATQDDEELMPFRFDNAFMALEPDEHEGTFLDALGEVANTLSNPEIVVGDRRSRKAAIFRICQIILKSKGIEFKRKATQNALLKAAEKQDASDWLRRWTRSAIRSDYRRTRRRP